MWWCGCFRRLPLSTKVLPLLSGARSVPALHVRYMKSIRRKRKKPIEKWFDPANKSWAQPVFDHDKKKESAVQSEPSMLHMVYRIRDHYTIPYWEKDVLKELNLFEKTYNPVVVKNTPEMNEKLRKVKHLVHIKPVTFPYGLPKDENDYKHCYLNENGEFIVRHRIPNEEGIQLPEMQEVEEESIWTMDKETIKKDARRTLLNWKLNDEYFKEQYVYKYNQDGKEYRYKGNHNIGNKRHDWY